MDIMSDQRFCDTVVIGPKLPDGWHIYGGHLYRERDSYSSVNHSLHDDSRGHWFQHNWYSIEKRIDLDDLIFGQDHDSVGAREELLSCYFSRRDGDSAPLPKPNPTGLKVEFKIKYSICCYVEQRRNESSFMEAWTSVIAYEDSLYENLVALAKEKIGQIRAAVEETR